MPDLKFFPPYLNQGSTGSAVVMLRLLLHHQGYAHAFPYGTLYDQRLARTVKTLQTDLGFKGQDIDGNFGPKTREAYARHFRTSPDEEIKDLFFGQTLWLGPDSKEPQSWSPDSERGDGRKFFDPGFSSMSDPER